MTRAQAARLALIHFAVLAAAVLALSLGGCTCEPAAIVRADGARLALSVQWYVWPFAFLAFCAWCIGRLRP